MDLEYGERYEEFRHEVRSFFDEHKDKKPKRGHGRLGSTARPSGLIERTRMSSTSS